MIDASCDDDKCSIIQNGRRFPCKKVKISGGRCNGSYTAKEQIGEGFFGTVYSLCNIENGCEYVFKVIKKLEKFDETEIELQMKASEAGIAPKILQVVYNGDNVGIIMEKLKYTMMDFLNDISILPKDARQIILLKNIVDVFDLLGKLHSLGILHNDNHISNIMWDTKTSKWMLIDFGYATMMLDKKFNNDFENFIEDIISTASIDDTDIDTDIIFRNLEHDKAIKLKTMWSKLREEKRSGWNYEL